MDKSWMQKSGASPEYLNGVTEFLNFAFDHTTNGDKILCPCTKCCNFYYKNREEVHGDLLWNGIMKRYTYWMSHGEDIYEEEYISDESDEGDDMQVMSKEALGMSNLDGGEDEKSPEEGGSSNSIGDDVGVHRYDPFPTPISIIGSMPRQSQIDYEELRNELKIMRHELEEFKMKQEENSRAFMEEMQRMQEWMCVTTAEMMRQMFGQRRP